MINERGEHYSERGKKAASKFSRLKALFMRRQAKEGNFMVERREDGLWIRPRPRYGVKP